MKKMKIVISTVIVATLLLLSGCGNMDFVDWHWTFNKARIRLNDNKWEEVKVKRWHDYDNSDMIAIETPHAVYVTHSVNVILIKEKED